MFEHYKQPLLPYRAFVIRVMRCIAVSLALLVSTIFIGTIALHFIERFAWLDAAFNSVMIMTGLGLIQPVVTHSGKIFTAIYAIASTIAFFTILVILITPVLHRVLHRFHLEVEGGNK